MSKYIIRRLLQAIPLLIIISFFLFILANAMGDPLASFGGRRRIRSQDRERLTRQLGLDQPIVVQYLIWLVGNDWMQIDVDGDGVADEPGTRRGVLRGDFGNSFMEKRPVMEIIGERVRNTLLLMVASEVCLAHRHLFGLAPVFHAGLCLYGLFVHRIFDARLLVRTYLDVCLCGEL
jgi:peptide/nickel transport system permease protein